ncbi:SGNH/GDSL hydrolase family protein [Parabacteroides chinchillae]|uniref:Lysophospholipase L1 n=1 Tax=Parabacteroides chinchillae TaxID=871327 RepID=A0A8G2BW95_9BACT|nr:SGNH/GDSL hydrolase family protein [Parabacteroides chinchillae]SEF84492.1 Lysophospholipase L1 [Parabacteroides chinchillae]
MKRIDILLLLLLGSIFCTTEVYAQQSTFIPADNSNILYTGRVSFQNPKSPAFTYPGVQIIINFEGTSLSMRVKPHSGYFTVELDGGKPFRVTSMENDSILPIASHLSKGKHKAVIMLAYEGRDFRPEFRGFYLDKGMKLLPPPALPEKKIEFIGNSITCGYGIEAEAESPFDYKDENFYYTYGATTARAFNAQHLVVAKSGIGVYRNYGDSIEGSAGTCLPDLYYQTQFMDSTETWDFSRYIPDVICINLGTNDVSNNTYDTGKLKNAYVNFIHDLRSYYPKAKIVLLSGVMLNGKPLKDVRNAMDQALAKLKTEGYTNVYRFDMTPQDGSLGYGSGWHPSMKQHKKMAKELVGFLQTITGWEVVQPVM